MCHFTLKTYGSSKAIVFREMKGVKNWKKRQGCITKYWNRISLFKNSKNVNGVYTKVSIKNWQHYDISERVHRDFHLRSLHESKVFNFAHACEKLRVGFLNNPQNFLKNPNRSSNFLVYFFSHWPLRFIFFLFYMVALPKQNSWFYLACRKVHERKLHQIEFFFSSSI